jgi:hypothetical protein
LSNIGKIRAISTKLLAKIGIIGPGIQPRLKMLSLRVRQPPENLSAAALSVIPALSAV